MVLCKCSLKIILTSLLGLVGLALYLLHWPKLLSFSAWHCRLGYLTCKIVPDMTYNEFGVTLNPTLILPLSPVSRTASDTEQPHTTPFYDTISSLVFREVCRLQPSPTLLSLSVCCHSFCSCGQRVLVFFVLLATRAGSGCFIGYKISLSLHWLAAG